MLKDYYIKIFDNTANKNLVSVLHKEIVDIPEFTYKINSIPGEFTFKLAKKIDDFGEDVIIKLKNKVQLIVRDKEANNGIIVYEGWISKYVKIKNDKIEYINVTVLHDGAEMSKFILEDSSNKTTLTYTNTEISTIIRDIIDKYRVINPTTSIKYDIGSIDSVGINITVNYKCVFVNEALDTILENCPEGWYWRINADGTFHFHNFDKANAAHFLTYKNIQTLKQQKDIEKLINKIYLIGGNIGFYQVAVDHGGYIYISSDYGVTWTQRASSKDWRGISISADGKYQTAIIASDYIYASSDYGFTWTQRDSSRDWEGISISADGKYQTAVVSTGYIYTSSDYGVTWTQRDSSRDWRSISLSADGKHQTAVVYGGYIYTSSDNGVTWTQRDSSRDWYFVANSSDGRYQTAVVFGGYIYTSSDYGVTWTQRDSSRNWRGVSISSDGKYQSAVVGSGYIYTSADNGVTWTQRDSSRNWRAVSVTSDGKYQTAVARSEYIYISSDYGVTWTQNADSRDWYAVANYFITSINLFFKKEEPTFKNVYGLFAQRKIDKRMTSQTTIDNYFDKTFQKMSNITEAIELTIPDSNDDDAGYDIESFNPGDSILIKGLNNNIYVLESVSYKYNKSILRIINLTFFKNIKLKEIETTLSNITSEGLLDNPTSLN